MPSLDVLKTELTKAIDNNAAELKTGFDVKVAELKTGLDVRVAELKTGLDVKVAELKTGLDVKAAELKTGLEDKIEAFKTLISSQLLATSHYARSRNANSLCQASSPLQPLVREVLNGAVAVGTLPPAGTFPVTREAVYRLGAAGLDAIEVFYNTVLPGGAGAADLRLRRDALSAFIGAPPMFQG